ncbi:MAG: hypothetical protein MI674_04140 [Cytophagales bacterium]|nr:hypothetical protein [Cytophagales bacterium]
MKSIVKKSLLFFVGILAPFFSSFAQEYAVITTIESVVPMGIGRSRMISNQQEMDVDAFTTERKQGTDTDQGQIRRRDLKIDNLEETKMLNFFSATGINFQNIASNDAMISSKLTQMAANGWELAFVVSGVESDGGETDGQGIFITRYIFKR